MAVNQLPPGFILDEPEEETRLPQGFILDEKRPARDTRPSSKSGLSQLLDIHPAPFGPSLREMPRSALEVLDTALFGLIPNRLKETLPSIESTRGKVGTSAGQLAALLFGGPGRAAAGTVRGISRLAPTMATSRMGRAGLRAIQGGVLGAGADITDTETFPSRTMAGSILGLLGPSAVEGGRRTVQAARALPEELALGRPSTLQKPNLLRTARFEQVRQRLVKAPKLAGQEFEQGLDDLIAQAPDQTVDLSAPLRQVQQSTQKNPGFRTLLERSARNDRESVAIQSVLNQPEVASSLRLKDSQAVKQVLQRALKQKFAQISPEYLASHLDALDAWHSIRSAQLGAFPQLEPVFKAYNQALSNFRLIKGALAEGNFEAAIAQDFSNNGALIRAFRELATPDTLKLVTRLQKATGLRSFLKRLGLLAGAGATFEVGRRIAGPTLGSVVRRSIPQQ